MSDAIQRSVDLPASPEDVWSKVTRHDWLGDDGEIDLRPGGEGWIECEGAARYLVVEEVDEPRRFVFRWATFTDEPTRVEIDLAPSEEGTRVTVTELPLRVTPPAQLLAA